jgi:hypothetical protein
VEPVDWKLRESFWAFLNNTLDTLSKIEPFLEAPPFKDGTTASLATNFSIKSSARGCRLIFGFFDSRKGIVSPAGGLSRRKELRHGIENDR